MPHGNEKNNMRGGIVFKARKDTMNKNTSPVFFGNFFKNEEIMAKMKKDMYLCRPVDDTNGQKIKSM